MPALTQQQMDALQAEITTNDIAGFYSLLESYGDSYGRLGAAVTNNDTWQGELANNFAEHGAADDSVNLSYGSAAWLELNKDVAQGYLAAYNNNNGTPPTREQIQTAHNDAYEDNNLDPDDWLPNKMLNDSGDPDALWADYLTNDGSGDLLGDALGIVTTSGKLLFGPYLLYKAMADGTVDESELAFAKSFLNGLANMSDNGMAAMANDVNPLQDLADFLSQFPEGARNLLNDYGWALGNLGALWDVLAPNLPDWIPGVTEPFEQSEQQFSPLVLDLSGTGINLAALGGEGSVYWNHNLGDFANASGWIAEGTGLLAIDLNEDGIINDHSELFGTESTDGFTVLSAYDSDTDDDIDSSDTDWESFLVWTDENSDGYSQAEELHTLDDLLITSINLNATQVNYDIAGNNISHESSFTIDGQTHDIVDAWFAYDITNTVYAADYDLDIRTLFLPTLRGYGTLPDLHIAMSLDETLLGMVQDFALTDLADFMDPAYELDAKVQDILFRWAGVQDVDPDSRGPFIDARVLGFLEAFVGRDYLAQSGSTSNPVATDTASLLMDAFTTAYTAISTRLLIQSAGSDLFSEAPVYDVVADTVDGNVGINVSTIEGLSSAFDHQILVHSIDFWKNILGVIDEVVGLDNLDQTTIDGIDDIIQNDDLSGYLDYGILAATFAADNAGWFAGDATANLLLTDKDDFSVNGYAGNDTLVANRTEGQALYGGEGNDTYVYGLGEGKITFGAGFNGFVQTIESLNEGTDTIQFTVGIDPDNVLMWTDNNGNLYVKYSATDYVRIQASSTYANGAYMTRVGEYVEQIVFDDETVWDLTGGLYLKNDDTGSSNYGTAYDDIVEGGIGYDYLFGGDGNDTLIGNAGSDTIDGGYGADMIIGNVGQDQEYGGAGNDTYLFNLGDSSNGSYYLTDHVYENLSEGTDRILFAAGIDPADVRLWTDSQGHLTIKYSDTDFIWVQASSIYANGASMTQIGEYLESIEFDDETVWDLTGGLHLKNDDAGGQNFGSAYDDIIEGGAGSDNNLSGGDGNDTLIGNVGQDYESGGIGNDTYLFNLGDSSNGSYYFTDRVHENLSEGTDRILFAAGIAPEDVRLWTDSQGHLTIKYSDTDFIWVPADYTYANGSYMTRVGEFVEQIVFDDETVWDLTDGLHLKNDDAGGQNFGSAYDDIIEGGAGSDNYLSGGDGNDTMIGGAGDDALIGGTGTDTADYSADGAGVTVSLSGGTALDGNSDTDTLSEIENITGSAFGDTLTGDNYDNVIEGLAGNDTLAGSSGTDTVTYTNSGSAVTVNLSNASAQNTVGAGTDTLSGFENLTGSAYNDTLTGNSSANVISGGSGNDKLSGGSGADTLYGQNGADTFEFLYASAFGNVDVVADFDITTYEDVLDLSDILDNTSYNHGTDPITDWVEITTNGSDSIVKVDRDGTGGTYSLTQIATLTGITGLTDEAALITSGNLLAA